jgi:hypothetical protein
MYGTRCQFAHLTLDHCSDYRQALSENVRQISIRISGVADPDITHFNVAAPQIRRLPVFEVNVPL